MPQRDSHSVRLADSKSSSGTLSGRPARRAEEYSGVAILLLCVGLGFVLYFAGVEPYIPSLLWLGVLVLSVAGLFIAGDVRRPRQVQLIAYGVSVVASWVIVASLSPANMGMLVVIMVVVAAVGAYAVPFWGALMVIVLNMTVVVGNFLLHGSDLTETLVASSFYLIIHFAAVFSTYALYRETDLRSELEQKNVELTAASVLLEDSAKTSERLRISRELHDLIGHQLTVLNLELEAARHRIPSSGEPPEVRETRSLEAEQVRVHIDRAAAVAKELLRDVRTTVGELREAGHGDLAAAIRRIAVAVPTLEIFVEVADDVVVDEEQTGVLVRAAQEMMTNTVRHADADELHLKVTYEDGEIHMTGVNDGYPAKHIVLGHGLTGLQERVELLGGQLRVHPSPEFTVEIRLPVRESAR